MLTVKQRRALKGNERNLRHGMTRGGKISPEYMAWAGMWARCTYPSMRSYKNYGGRGISVCARWKDPALFLADMGPRPSAKHSLDRKNNDGNYTPKNCRWATAEEQQSNTRANHNLTIEGRTQTVSQWARERGLAWSLVFQRLGNGWSPERALEPSTKETRPDVQAAVRGAGYESPHAFIKATGISPATLYNFFTGKPHPKTVERFAALGIVREK